MTRHRPTEETAWATHGVRCIYCAGAWPCAPALDQYRRERQGVPVDPPYVAPTVTRLHPGHPDLGWAAPVSSAPVSTGAAVAFVLAVVATVTALALTVALL